MMNLVRYNPSSWFDRAFDRMVDDLFAQGGPAAGPVAAQATLVPRVDIRENKEAVILSAELPGLERDAIHVEVENGVLTLSAEKKQEATDEQDGFFRSERAYGTFQRSFALPDSVDGERIEAEYINGVLKLTLPKRPEAAPRQIEVKAGEGDAKQIGVN